VFGLPVSVDSPAAVRDRSYGDTGRHLLEDWSQHRVWTVSTGGGTPSGDHGPEQDYLQCNSAVQ